MKLEDNTVDGRNPKQPPGTYKTLKIMGNKPTSTGEPRISEASTVGCLGNSKFRRWTSPSRWRMRRAQ